MPSFVSLLQQGHSWLFVPSAILLGALHGLEPGHSKTMMAAFIVAIRGTVAQAVLLGLSATVSHTAIVWLIALGGLYFGRNWNTETTEPYFQVVSAVLIIAVAAWMLWRTRRESLRSRDAAGGSDHHGHGHPHGHAHSHDHAHGHEEARRIDTGHGVLRLAIFEGGVAARFRLHVESGPSWSADQVQIETERADGSHELFSFRRHGGYLESAQQIPEPHEFIVRLRLGPAAHRHDFDLEFVEGQHRHALAGFEALDLTAPGYQDPHELAHADDIRRRFASREVTTAQIVVFGLTGGLIPCPASITVLLLCLQLKKVALGAVLVLCFSIGLALTMVTTGAVAALGARHAARRFSGFGELARKAPYFSGAVILVIGVYIGYQGLHALT
ncbi:MAG TPA: nickel/cobalt efflux transporter [Steroidobacteraceae bacterium]|jgi:nickel/cobalt exporter|nr:nickel/cobalt efflux transporter [Steroidobacteraceae bacterium]